MRVEKGYKIAYKGLKNGPHDFEFRVDGALFEAFGSTEIKDGACVAEVRLERAETQLVLDIAIRGSVTVACDRCLEDCSVPIGYEGRLLVKFSQEVHEYDGEVLWLLPGEDEVDLAQYIYESIILSLPYQRVHADGSCDPEMLARFRIVTDEEFSRIEARASEEDGPDGGGPWEKLAELKREMEASEDEEKQ